MIRSGYVYHCAAGESWDSVALELYGDEKYAAELLSANPALCHMVVFEGGEILYIPVVEQTGEGETVYTPANAPWKD